MFVFNIMENVLNKLKHKMETRKTLTCVSKSMMVFFYHLKTSHSAALRKVYVAVAEALFGFI